MTQFSLTPRQADLKRFFVQYLADHRICPSYSEMGASMGLARSGIHRLVEGLIERGHLARGPGRARSLYLVRHVCSHCGHDLAVAVVHPEDENGVSP